jgi:myo-inositol-1(or 4)-monophosphatase
VAEKTSAADLVTEIDRAAERAIVEGIVAARPDDAILGEEGTDRAGSSGVRWVIDPLDGTTNYVRGYPTSCVSIGVEIDGEPAIGAAIDALGRCTDGVVGSRRARRQPDPPVDPTSLDGAVLATGRLRGRAARGRGAHPRRGDRRIADIRRSGSAAFDLQAAASGEVDAYFELFLAPWDAAAGRAIVLGGGWRLPPGRAARRRGAHRGLPTQLLEPPWRLCRCRPDDPLARLHEVAQQTEHVVHVERLGDERVRAEPAAFARSPRLERADRTTTRGRSSSGNERRCSSTVQPSILGIITSKSMRDG